MALQQRSVRAYAFGPFVLHLRNHVLYRMGLPVEMHARLFDILQCLVTNSDRLVTKELLVDQVWGGLPIGDNNIAQHMHMVREVLGDLSKPYRYVATVHGRGYRMIAEPRAIVEGPSEARASAPPDLLGRTLASELLSNAAFFMTMGTPAALDSAAQIARKALEIDPRLADAHAAIAMSALLKGAFVFGVPTQQYAIARRHASQALALESQCARAHVVMAALAILEDLSPARAHAHLEAAAAILPELAEIGIVRVLAHSAQGLHAQALEAARSALVLHPSSCAVAAYGAFAEYVSGDLDRAAATLDRLLVFKPGAAFPTYLLGLTRLAQTNYSAAREVFEELLAARISLIPAYEKFRVRAVAALAFIEARSGSPEDARALARDVERSTHPSYVALALARAGTGERDAVLAALESAREQRDPWFAFVAADPVFAEFRDVPQFARIVRLEDGDENMNF
ncbi:MAG TPA: winged helix-turn-helix domain-containing protein [Candidatus Baltobacteraceae bacterium]|nr:winged helix-turn-helix domain-containing protein [Candidatus Baltobacteraceae bacterium]